MKAIVIKPFRGLPDRETTVRDFVDGDTVTGDLAAVAVREGWAIEDSEGGGAGQSQPPPPPQDPPVKATKKKTKADGADGGEGQ